MLLKLHMIELFGYSYRLGFGECNNLALVLASDAHLLPVELPEIASTGR